MIKQLKTNTALQIFLLSFFAIVIQMIVKIPGLLYFGLILSFCILFVAYSVWKQLDRARKATAITELNEITSEKIKGYEQLSNQINDGIIPINLAIESMKKRINEHEA